MVHAPEMAQVVTGKFNQSVRVRQALWYREHLVELLPIHAAQKNGGQVLLTPEQAIDLIVALAQAVADAKAEVITPPAMTDGGAS